MRGYRSCRPEVAKKPKKKSLVKADSGGWLDGQMEAAMLEKRYKSEKQKLAVSLLHA